MPLDAHGCIATLAALSLSMDAANARPPETSLRIAVLASALADIAGLTAEQRVHAYFTALLRFLGCTSFAHEESELFGGDDVEARRIFGPIDADSKVDIMRATLGTLANEPRLGDRIARCDARHFSERALARSPALASAGTLCMSHHERLDGSGYPGRTPASARTFAARLLAAADVFTALQESRPHRPARSLDEASAVLEAEVANSRLDREAVRAILEASHRPARAQNLPWPAGLTDREVETLRLVAVGLSNKEIGNELGISWRTVQHHVQHGYDKLGVSTRAAAALRLIDLDLLRR